MISPVSFIIAYVFLTEPPGLNLTILGSRPEPKSGVRRLTDWATQAPLKILFLSNLYTLQEAQVYNPQVKSRMLHQLSQLGALVSKEFKGCNS